MTDVFTPEKRSWLMGRIGGRDTKPEMKVRRTAHAMGLRYSLHKKGLPGTPDVAFVRRRVALYVHGCFWHRHPDCRLASTPKSNPEFWAEKFRRNVERDARVEDSLTKLGWRPAVIWECETRSSEDLARIICERVMAD